MYPKKSRGAMAALLFAGGMWAYQNRDKVRGWVNQYMGSMNSPATSTSPSTRAFTGETRRIDEAEPRSTVTKPDGSDI